MSIFGNRKPTEKQVKSLLSDVKGVEVQSVLIEDGRLCLVAEVAAALATPETERAIELRLRKVWGKKPVQVILTAHAPAAPQMPVSGKKRPTKTVELPVKHVIAVASGKGGVGKSTVAVNLAASLAKMGLKVGVLDADIYGPSLPRMTDTVLQKPELEGGKMKPIEAYGLQLISMGYLVEEAAPMIWRGPMIQSALKQLLGDVDWSGCEVLIIDLPPGTGDAQLTLVQQVKLSGAVIVSTPQDIALIDARKGLEMFRKTDVPILGVVENMSYFCCVECGARNEVFGHGGARAEAEKTGVPFLGEIPLHARIREQGDLGVPFVVAAPESEQALAFDALAKVVFEKVSAA